MDHDASRAHKRAHDTDPFALAFKALGLALVAGGVMFGFFVLGTWFSRRSAAGALGGDFDPPLMPLMPPPALDLEGSPEALGAPLARERWSLATARLLPPAPPVGGLGGGFGTRFPSGHLLVVDGPRQILGPARDGLPRSVTIVSSGPLRLSHASSMDGGGSPVPSNSPLTIRLHPGSSLWAKATSAGGDVDYGLTVTPIGV